MNAKPKKLLDQVRDQLRLKYYSCRTEESCVDWIRRFILFSLKSGELPVRHASYVLIDGFGGRPGGRPVQVLLGH
jgi:hypothetical protein